jgi:cellulose synthase/poly-beta-1,6-N-acetylglucosamine synthase-like glycosyltransferase
MNADQLPDFILPLKVVVQGYRVVYEPEAVLWEHSLKDAEDEYRMRVRVSLRAFWALFDMRQLLGPGINPFFAWQLWSHKLLRYLCFLFLLIAYVTNWLLLGNGGGYKAILVLQHVGYMSALVAPRIKVVGIWGNLLTFSRYFFLLNLAAAHAFGKFLLGKKQLIWTPRKG